VTINNGAKLRKLKVLHKKSPPEDKEVAQVVQMLIASDMKLPVKECCERVVKPKQVTRKRQTISRAYYRWAAGS